jgi:multisubunit Na+/H+ antiporter MnhB subunit
MDDLQRLPLRLLTRTAPGRALLAAFTLALAVILGAVVLDLPEEGTSAATPALDRRDDTMPESDVTAVLLDIRVYDTFFEVGVLLMTGVAALAVRRDAGARTIGPAPAVSPIVRRHAHRVAPVVGLAGVYLLSQGTSAPGGALEAGAILATGVMILRLAGYRGIGASPGPALRAGLLFALAAFLLFGGVSLLVGNEPFEHVAQWRMPAIVALEVAITVSVATALALLFVTTSPPPELGELEQIEEDPS